MKRLRLALLSSLLLATGCPATSDEVTNSATALGFADVRQGDAAVFSCGQERGSHFTARNAQGVKVRGVVCCGYLLKACTVRGLRASGGAQ